MVHFSALTVKKQDGGRKMTLAKMQKKYEEKNEGKKMSLAKTQRRKRRTGRSSQEDRGEKNEEDENEEKTKGGKCSGMRENRWKLRGRKRRRGNKENKEDS